MDGTMARKRPAAEETAQLRSSDSGWREEQRPERVAVAAWNSQHFAG